MSANNTSEIIVNADGSIYHLNLHPNDVATTILFVGDPERVPVVSKHFDRIEIQKQKREFVTHTGYIGDKRLSVISTGIGTDNIDIVINELDVLFNWDFDQQTPHTSFTPLQFIRLGTSGALQADIPVDSLLVSSLAIGLDNLLHFYKHQPSAVETELNEAFMNHLNTLPVKAYTAKGSSDLIEHIGKDMLRGITITAPGFYAPQGRSGSAQPLHQNFTEQLSSFSHHGMRCTNMEMETSGIYGLSNLLGHHACSCNAILANRINQKFSLQPQQTVERLIMQVLERLA